MLLGPPCVSRMVPGAEQHLAHVGLVVAVGVLEEQRLRARRRRSRRRGRRAMLVGMLSFSAKTVNLSARPSPSVSSQMTMRSRPLRRRAAARWGSRSSRRPTAGRARPRSCRSACRRVPARRRTASARNPFGHDDVLQRLLGGQRLLHLGERLALPAARPVVRDLLADVDVLERLHVGPLRGHLRDRERPVERRRGGGRGRPAPAASPSSGPGRRPSGCRARPGSGSPGCPRCAGRGPRRCRRRGPCPACAPRSTAPCVSPSTRYSRTVRSFSLCLVWT